MKDKLKSIIEERLATEIPVTSRSPLKYLKKFSVDDYLDSIISVVHLYTRLKRGSTHTILFVEVISAIGHSVRSLLKQKTDSALAAKTGAFFLYAFEALGMLQVTLGKGSKGHATYIIQVIDDEKICELWAQVPDNKAEKMPALIPFDDWISSRHSTGKAIIKTTNKEVLAQVTPETHPIIFESLNKSQHVGWRINEDIYKLYTWALRNKTEAFSDIWDQSNPEARATKLREARAIGDIARRLLGATFFHLYYYDFRGRKYPTSAYLHEQGSDLARGLLLRDDRAPIGKEGYEWLLISIASNWAGSSGRDDGAKTDKIPLKERTFWVLDNEELILSYALEPKINQGWMKADKPWQFLAACNELMKLRMWQSQKGDFECYDYESSLECYIDGSNNGSQHLSALTMDEETAVHVNLVPSDLPGDLYKYVADHVWDTLDSIVSSMDSKLVADCERFIRKLMEIKKQIQAAEPKSQLRKELIEEIRSFKEDNIELMEASSPVYWSLITDSKERRKIVKRNVMTLPYGGTKYGLGQQQIDDAKKHGIEWLLYMEHRWGAYMGRLVYDDCCVSLRRPMQLLSVFEDAGKFAEDDGRFLKWTVPVTNFPVVQNYTEGRVKKIWVQYGPPQGERLSTGYYINTFQIAVSFLEDPIPSKNKQSQGASPNAIHSLDAAHLTLTVYRADYPITTIHDSYGALLRDMPKLYKLVRETFVELYEADPLYEIMSAIEGDITSVEFGTLDLNLVKDSEYCFV
jgi:DNA-directed RNA polymerase